MIPYLRFDGCASSSCRCFWWIWTVTLHLDKSRGQDVGQLAKFENAKVIYMIVVSRFFPQLFFALRPDDEGILGLECHLHRIGNVHTLDWVAGDNTMLSIYDPEPSILDVILGGRPLTQLWHDTQCVFGGAVGHVKEVVLYLLHLSFFICSNCPVQGSKVQLVNPHLPLLIHLKDVAPLAFYSEPLVDFSDRIKISFIVILQFYRHLY